MLKSYQNKYNNIAKHNIHPMCNIENHNVLHYKSNRIGALDTRIERLG